MASADYRSPFRVLRDNEIYIMQICLSCFVIKFGWRILWKHGRLGGPVPIALLYYSTNVIAVLCAGQLILRTRDSFPHTQGEREREREREKEREGERLRLGTRYPNGIDFAIKLINATPVAGNHTLLF